ncbi:MAG TPA: hypothetical protein VEI73_04105 [Candidatus Acidoferrum sp.]|nr:hypothetical protein [Candidatus Acidoferrum sp.]
MKTQTRRDFLAKTVPGTAIAGFGLSALHPLFSLGSPQLTATGTTSPRAYTAGRYTLNLGGQFAGPLNSVEGGNVTADVIAKGPLPQKQIPGVKYADITMKCGMGMSREFYEWIIATLAQQIVSKNGAIDGCDFNNRILTRMNWFNALMTQVIFPACDMTLQDPAMMTVRLTPQEIQMTSGNLGSAGQPSGKPGAQVNWSPANFRLEIDGIDCSHVSKIEPVSAQFFTGPDLTQAALSTAGASSKKHFSNLVITLPEAQAVSFYQWYRAAVVQGNQSGTQQRPGILEYLTPSRNDAIFALRFRGLNILSFTQAVNTAGSGLVPNVNVQMSCADLGFAYTAAALA